MAQSLSKIYVHIIFGTRNRENLIKKHDLPQLFKYLNGMIRKLGGGQCKIGGTSNHVHILTTLPRTISPSKYIEKIKCSSSRWMKELCTHYDQFAWQRGYGIFSVSPSKVKAVESYILNQESHHQKKSFEDELIEFLNGYDVEYDENYLWN